MQMTRRWGLTLAGVAALAGIGLSRVAAAPAVGKPAPAFAAPTVDGKKVSLANYKGKSGVLLNFYANY